MWQVMDAHSIAKIYAALVLTSVVFAYFVGRIAAWWRE